jgi:hypothetical protein
MPDAHFFNETFFYNLPKSFITKLISAYPESCPAAASRLARMLSDTFSSLPNGPEKWEPLDAIRPGGYDPKKLGKSLRRERPPAPAKADRDTSAVSAGET